MQVVVTLIVPESTTVGQYGKHDKELNWRKHEKHLFWNIIG